jgi:hypothetical protein
LPDELVAEYKRLATPEGCYERACKLGCENLEWEWLVIEALAECLLQEGYLTGEDVEVIIKAVQAEEEA